MHAGELWVYSAPVLFLAKCVISITTADLPWRQQFHKLPGELLVYNASFEKDNSRSLSWPGVQLLQLKRGCYAGVELHTTLSMEAWFYWCSG